MPSRDQCLITTRQREPSVLHIYLIMLHIQAVAAYSCASTLAIAGIFFTIFSLRDPWFSNKSGHYAYLTKYCLNTDFNCAEFPSKRLCDDYPGFCAAWKTAVFGLILTVAVNVVILLAIIFSWICRKRKRTALMVRVLSGVSLVIDLIVFTCFQALYSHAKFMQHGGWKWVAGGGLSKLVSAITSLGILFILMFFFRAIIISPDENPDYDSDDDDESFDDDNYDTVSIEEDVSEEDRDFYVFNKVARRQALRSGQVTPTHAA